MKIILISVTAAMHAITCFRIFASFNRLRCNKLGTIPALNNCIRYLAPTCFKNMVVGVMNDGRFES